ncbi:DUF4166 domain-containing protein [Singulisphaera sp. PoT]|uniref:DUF4166 domain-containing protein n=1 Tax=Singulisphaera sp. PoT TaxID=3411797 RepID=UPI003BF551B7
MAPPSLYRRILGDRFDALPEVLRRFHDSPRGGRARGTLRVERAAGVCQNALASVLGLPRAGDVVEVRLEVEVVGDRERWVRHLQGRTMKTVQYARGGLLVESIGPSAFASELILDGPFLNLEFRRAWVLGVPLPKRLAPLVDGRVVAGEGGWQLAVRVEVPILGELVRYEGWIEPE